MQFGVAGLIPHAVKLQTKVTLLRLSQVEMVGLVVPRSVRLCCQSGGGASILLLSSSCNHVTGVGGPYNLLEEH